MVMILGILYIYTIFYILYYLMPLIKLKTEKKHVFSIEIHFI